MLPGTHDYLTVQEVQPGREMANAISNKSCILVIPSKVAVRGSVSNISMLGGMNTPVGGFAACESIKGVRESNAVWSIRKVMVFGVISSMAITEIETTYEKIGVWEIPVCEKNLERKGMYDE